MPMQHQQVDIVIITINRYVVLSAYVCKATPHFKKKIGNLACQWFFYIQFVLQCNRSNEWKVVRVFEYVASQVRLRRGGKVCSKLLMAWPFAWIYPLSIWRSITSRLHPFWAVSVIYRHALLRLSPWAAMKYGDTKIFLQVALAKMENLDIAWHI